jgi:hypothetical protein
VERGPNGPVLLLSGEFDVSRFGSSPGRPGPDGWTEEARHKLRAALRYGKDGRIVQIEIEDSLQTDGRFVVGERREEYVISARVSIESAEPILGPDQWRTAERAIEELGHDEYPVRERGSKTLLNLGEAIIPMLKERGLMSDDPEVRTRAALILAELERGAAGR